MKYKELKKLRKKCLDEVIEECNAKQVTVELLTLVEVRLNTRLQACGVIKKKVSASDEMEWMDNLGEDDE